MKTLLLVMAIVALSVLSPAAYGDETSQKAIVEDLLKTMKVDQITKPVFDQVRSMMEQKFAQMGAPEDMRPILKKYTDKLVDTMEQSLSWQNIKEDMINVYVHLFTEDELKGMLAFYKSPVGQSVIDKMPATLQLSMAAMQKHMPEVQEKVKKLDDELAEEVKAEIQKKKPVSKISPQAKDTTKLPATRRAKWPLLVGKWFGSTSTKEGGKYMWIADERNDGSHTIQFRTIDPAGKKVDKIESGEWGVSGDVYFEIYKADIRDGKPVPADPTNPANRDAYKIITLTQELFVYEGMDDGVRFEARKVPSDFTFPE
jgi:hypothetical protein